MPEVVRGVRPRVVIVVIAAACGLLQSVLPTIAQDAPQSSQAATPGNWPQFLGPERNGISPETGLLETWPADGPPEVWRTDGGVGMSGLVISDGALFTMVQKAGKQVVVSHSAATGEARWEAPIAPAFENQMGDGPRATPAVAGETLYAFSGEGILAALATSNGSIRWSKNVVQELAGKPAAYGMVSSPLLVGENVIVTLGVADATLAAFDRESGELAWAAGKNDSAGYSSPVLISLSGRKQVVAFNGDAALGVAPDTGSTLWRYPFKTDYECNIAVPLKVDENLFLSAGENHGCVMLSLESTGGKVSIDTAWESQGTGSVMRNEWQTSILRDGYLYGLDNVGSAGPVTHLTCVEAATGERIWQQRRFGKGNLISADGKLFLSTTQGELVVVRATPDAYQELGRKQILDQTRQAPSLAGGLLYLRDDREIVCIDVRKQ